MKPVVIEIQVSQLEQMEEELAVGQGPYSVPADVEAPERRQIAHGGWKRRQSIAAQIQFLQYVLLACNSRASSIASFGSLFDDTFVSFLSMITLLSNYESRFDYWASPTIRIGFGLDLDWI